MILNSVRVFVTVLLLSSCVFGTAQTGGTDQRIADTTGSAHDVRMKQAIEDGNWRGRVEQHLENGNGSIVEYGTPLIGYSFNIFDTTTTSNITAITEYIDGLKNGRRVQFFNYPNDTASVETYLNDSLNGPFFFNYANGMRKVSGMWRHNELQDARYFFEDGEVVQDTVIYRASDSTYALPNGSLISGRFSTLSHGTGPWVSGKQADLFFTAGRIDSLYLYDPAWWGIFSVKQVDYFHRKRRYIIYNEQSLPVRIVECEILGYEPERLIWMEGHLFALEKTTLDPTLIVTTLTYDRDGKELERQTQTYQR